MVLSSVENLGIARILERGTADILAETGHGILVRDTVSGVYMVSADSPEVGQTMLRAHCAEEMPMLIAVGEPLAEWALTAFGFTGIHKCVQVAYLRPEPPAVSPALRIRPAAEEDIPWIAAHYEFPDEEEFRKGIAEKTLLIGMEDGERVGFAGEHSEGSMGLLFVLPAFRRRGYGELLESAVIADTMRRGYIPYGQVIHTNAASLSLQKKLGMTAGAELVSWMWRGE